MHLDEEMEASESRRRSCNKQSSKSSIQSVTLDLNSSLRNGPTTSQEQKGKASSGAFGGSGNRLGSEDDDEADSPAESSGTLNQPTDTAPGANTGGARVGLISPSGMDALLASMFGGRGVGGPPMPPPAQDDDDENGEPAVRHLTFWRNGFSIEDGPLLSYDEPDNKELLEAIEAGRAPPTVFNVRWNQPLQVEVAKRLNEDYQPPPKRPMKAFTGGGNRLGSPTPEVVSGSTTPTMPGGMASHQASSSAATGAAAAPNATAFAVDTSKPTTSIQVRLADGTK